ncbi:MAG: DUF2339 domain-containing protein [Ferruginibacter sp.]
MMHTDHHDELEERLQQMQQEIDACRQEIDSLKKRLSGYAGQPRPSAPSRSANPVNTLENFIGLKLIHFVGIVVLFIGLSIGVKYAIDINLISPAMRIILAYAAGLALLILSFRLRNKYELFSLILFSGAMATFYFTTYGAFEFYALLGRIPAFAIMLALTIFTVYTAITYNRSVIAVLGLVGAYAIPFFVRGNESNIGTLLSYILLINLGVLFISFKKYWLSLNYVAFFSTWIIYFGCQYVDHTELHFTRQLFGFAFVFFILFLLSTLGFKLYRKYSIAFEDAGLISLNTIFLYTALDILISYLDTGSDYRLSLWFAIALLIAGAACMYFLKKQQFLGSSFYVLGVIALAGYVALHYEGFTITIIWVILAIVLFVIGMLVRLKVLRILSILLFGGTIVKLLALDSSEFTAVQKVIAYVFTGAVLLVVSFLYQRFRQMIFGEDDRNNA